MTAERKIPERSQIPVEETWNLADIYSSDEAWREDFDATRALAQKLPGYAGRLGRAPRPSTSSWSWSRRWAST